MYQTMFLLSKSSNMTSVRTVDVSEAVVFDPVIYNDII